MTDDRAQRVLLAVDDLQPAMMGLVGDVVRIPSVSGSDAENDAQAHVAGLFAAAGLDVDHRRLDLDALQADPDFPGMEVDRREAWGLVGRRPGAGGGATLILNGHVDVVPTGDPDAWTTAPFLGETGVGGCTAAARAT
jgi:acetylornithine deacetylase